MRAGPRSLAAGLGAGLLLSACAAPAAFQPPAFRPLEPQFTGPSLRDRQRERLRNVIGEDEYLAPPIYMFESSIGARSFEDEAGWDPLENQLDLGLLFASPLLGERSLDRTAGTDWFSWELGVRYSFDSSRRTARELEARIVELDAGIMIEPPNPDARLRPFVSGGAALTFTDVREETAGAETLRERDVITSPYVRVGLRFNYEETGYFGVDVRWTEGRDRPVDGVGASLDSTTVSLLLGARF